MTEPLWTDERIDGFANRIPFVSDVVAAWMRAMRYEYEARIAHLQAGYMAELNTVEQALGDVLGYTRYCDNPEIFPDATEADGVCVGIHTAGTLAMEAADVIKALKARIAELEEIDPSE